MKIKKKTIIISVAAVAVIGAGIGVLGKNFRNSQVNVYPVTDLSQSIWQSGTSLDGTIASQVSQEVRLQENQIVSAVHVQEGQEVKKGDPLLTYDMTLINIDLETEKLSRQQLEIKKKGLEQELEKLKKDRQFGKYVSFFTMGDRVEGVTLTGFKYPLKDHTLVNSDEIGVSNEIQEDSAEITFRSGVVLMIMSKDRNIQ